jgi:hypothetical protein
MAIANQNGNSLHGPQAITVQANAENVVKQFLARAAHYPHWTIKENKPNSFKCTPACIDAIVRLLKDTYHCGYALSGGDGGWITVTVQPLTFRFE